MVESFVFTSTLNPNQNYRKYYFPRDILSGLNLLVTTFACLDGFDFQASLDLLVLEAGSLAFKTVVDLLGSISARSLISVSSSSSGFDDFHLSIHTDMATVAKAMACPESGLEVRDRMWLKITIANAFIGTSGFLHFVHY